jgi:hypothetical protein
MVGHSMMEHAMVAMERMAMLSGRVDGVAAQNLVQVGGRAPLSFLRIWQQAIRRT